MGCFRHEVNFGNEYILIQFCPCKEVASANPIWLNLTDLLKSVNVLFANFDFSFPKLESNSNLTTSWITISWFLLVSHRGIIYWSEARMNKQESWCTGSAVSQEAVIFFSPPWEPEISQKKVLTEREPLAKMCRPFVFLFLDTRIVSKSLYARNTKNTRTYARKTIPENPNGVCTQRKTLKWSWGIITGKEIERRKFVQMLVDFSKELSSPNNALWC